MVSIFSLMLSSSGYRNLNLLGFWQAATTALRQLDRARAAFGPVIADHGVFGSGGFGELADQLDLSRRIVLEAIHADDHRNAELARVADVAQQVGAAFFEQVQILLRVLVRERLARDHLRPAAVHLERADGRHQHHAIRRQPASSGT